MSFSILLQYSWQNFFSNTSISEPWLLLRLDRFQRGFKRVEPQQICWCCIAPQSQGSSLKFTRDSTPRKPMAFFRGRLSFFLSKDGRFSHSSFFFSLTLSNVFLASESSPKAKLMSSNNEKEAGGRDGGGFHSPLPPLKIQLASH